VRSTAAAALAFDVTGLKEEVAPEIVLPAIPEGGNVSKVSDQKLKELPALAKVEAPIEGEAIPAVEVEAAPALVATEVEATLAPVVGFS
jgi:hypothetical protein